MNPIF
jgi:translation initiation factor 3 subunit M